MLGNYGILGMIETTIKDDKQCVETLNKITEEVINDNKTEIEIIPNDQNREQVGQKIEDNGIKKQIIKKTEERRITPVSYTHLDVYKRQTVYRP